MENLRLGRTGMMVTRLGFGSIPIQRLPENEAVAVIKRCLDLGINFLDTANSYGTSEERIGKAIKGRRDSLFLATKSGSRNPEEFQKHIQLSLTRLGVEYIDLFQFHGVSDFKSLDKIMEPGGVLTVAEEAKKKGQIRHIGITCHQIDVAKKAVQTDLFESLMFPLNFITSEAIDLLLPICRKHNVGFICMKPLAGGMINRADICFKYLFQFPDVVSIPGIERVSEIEEIVNILETTPTMTPADKKEMKRIKDELGPRFCHRCDYCQPSSTGIPISMIMTAKSFYKRLPPERFYSPMIIPGMEKAAKCSQCGECETRCPYHLPIREMIAEQVAWFQDLIKKREQEVTKKA